MVRSWARAVRGRRRGIVGSVAGLTVTEPSKLKRCRRLEKSD